MGWQTKTHQSSPQTNAANSAALTLLSCSTTMGLKFLPPNWPWSLRSPETKLSHTGHSFSPRPSKVPKSINFFLKSSPLPQELLLPPLRRKRRKRRKKRSRMSTWVDSSEEMMTITEQRGPETGPKHESQKRFKVSSI